MKRSTTIALIIVLGTMLIAPQTMALTSQGLYYRPHNGDRFYFSMDITDEGDVNPTEIIYFEMTNTSVDIPDPLNHLSNLSYLEKDIMYENGTSLGLLTLIFLFMPNLEYPVGNWELISSLAETDLEDGLFFFEIRDLTISQDDDLWGYTYETNTSSDTYNEITVTYSKFDGVLYDYVATYNNATDDSNIESYEIHRIYDHTLEWGINDGDRFDFHLVVTGDKLGLSDIDEQYYIEIDDNGLDIIPYTLNDFDDLPYFTGYAYWANDSLMFTSYLIYTLRIAVPIGDWTLLDSFITDLTPTVNITLDDPDPYFWGYTWYDTSGAIAFESHTTFLKVDGFLAQHSVTFTNLTDSEEIGTISVERTGLEPYTDRTPPLVNSPDDVEFSAGTTNQSITWIAIDENPTTYQVLVDGTVEDSGTWTSGESITLELDDFEAGTYNCTIVVFDIAGSYVRDSVLVTVTAGGILPDIIMDNLLYIGIGVGVVVILGAIVCVRRK